MSAQPAPDGSGSEELWFEVTREQALGEFTTKARELVESGVRRVICLVPEIPRVLEWSPEVDGWATLPVDAAIEDRCLKEPLPVRTLISAARVIDGVEEAARVKSPEPIERAWLESRLAWEGIGYEDGALREARWTLLEVLHMRGVKPSDVVLAKVSRCGERAQLHRWFRRALTATSAADAVALFDDSNEGTSGG
ncbi:hypothetical protein [Sorangium sp. So ce362]|uniref:hypothetical protein n=1 Tax=Sorangium sp. So ce362 TaxID=3133303 RepID=UPI003F64700E